MAKNVVLLDFWPSPFGMRVKISLAEKGVDYEYREEDLRNKSELLLKMNPVHKKIPVLIHSDKPICESLVIVQYVDEVWNHKSPLLPSDPYERAQARFWADYIDKKVYEAGRKIYAHNKGNDQELETAKQEFIDVFKLIEEKALGDKPYLGGESFGFLDVVLIPFWSWIYSYETLGGFKLQDSCPKLTAWANRCMERESVSKTLPDSQKVYDFVLLVRKWIGVD